MAGTQDALRAPGAAPIVLPSRRMGKVIPFPSQAELPLRRS